LQFQIDPLSSEFKPSINKLQTEYVNNRGDERREAGEEEIYGPWTLGLSAKKQGRREASRAEEVQACSRVSGGGGAGEKQAGGGVVAARKP
jgi:hypothetical protein